MTEYEQLMAMIRARRSIRRFSAKTVSRDDLLRLVEAARWAPSNHNRQPWKFIVVEDQSQIVQLAERVGARLTEKLKELPPTVAGYAGDFAHYATFFSHVPVLIAVLHKRPIMLSDSLLQGLSQPELISGEPLSTAMAVQNLLLAAHALGLGACVLTAPLIARAEVLRALNPPAGHDITCLIALGYPDEKLPQPRRKSIEHIAEFRNDGDNMEQQ